jgi:hypothetical protein
MRGYSGREMAICHAKMLLALLSPSHPHVCVARDNRLPTET